jgi:hypothetical protein
MACLGLHLCLIATVCLRDTFSVFANTPTILPVASGKIWASSEQTAAALLGERLGQSNWVRNAIVVYLHTAGIEAGYGFFAPNVPPNYKLVFELHYLDGHTAYEVPTVGSAATGMRFAGLLDQLAQENYAPLRETMMKIVAYSVWERHPSATKIRAYLGCAYLPAPAEFMKGEKESYELLFAYNFSFDRKQP